MTETILRNVTIFACKRIGASVNGNPRFMITFSDGTMAATSSDASVSYDVENVARSGVAVDVTLTRAGRVSHWQRVKSSD